MTVAAVEMKHVPRLAGAGPFVKSAGGKTKLLPEILPRIPVFSGRYYEPFVGGGAVLFALRVSGRANVFASAKGQGCIINDFNKELVGAYIAVRDNPRELIKELKTIKHSKEVYYAIRASEPKTSIGRAARYIYLNHTCFNGLYRVNKSGKFNVPMGDYKNPTICDEPGLLSASLALAGVTATAQDFELVIAGAGKNDFVYCDPPYLPRSKTADFTSYTADRFVLRDHERLVHALTLAGKRGAKFMLSEGDSEAVRALFKGFNIIGVSCKHMVGARVASRVKVDELLITNY